MLILSFVSINSLKSNIFLHIIDLGSLLLTGISSYIVEIDVHAEEITRLETSCIISKTESG